MTKFKTCPNLWLSPWTFESAESKHPLVATLSYIAQPLFLIYPTEAILSAPHCPQYRAKAPMGGDITLSSRSSASSRFTSSSGLVATAVRS